MRLDHHVRGKLPTEKRHVSTARAGSRHRRAAVVAVVRGVPRPGTDRHSERLMERACVRGGNDTRLLRERVDVVVCQPGRRRQRGPPSGGCATERTQRRPRLPRGCLASPRWVSSAIRRKTGSGIASAHFRQRCVSRRTSGKTVTQYRSAASVKATASRSRRQAFGPMAHSLPATRTGP